jgi:hypothetical protein
VGYRDFLRRQEVLGAGLFGGAGPRSEGGPGGGKTARDSAFARLEANYQRYRDLLASEDGGSKRRLHSRYDLAATLRKGVFDPQPFMNALLHSMGMEEIVTLDYDIDSTSLDTLVVTVYWGAGTEDSSGELRLSEGDLRLYVTEHAASLLPPDN